MPPKAVKVKVSTEDGSSEKKPRKKRETKKKDDSSSVSSKLDLGDCTICCSPFNRSINSKSVCPHCQTEICKSCIQTYLLSSLKDPHCMNCKNYWSQEILQDLTSKAFRTGEYKAHRQNILLDREKGFLQLAQPYVEDTAKARRYHKLYDGHMNCVNLYAELERCLINYRKSVQELTTYQSRFEKIEENKDIRFKESYKILQEKQDNTLDMVAKIANDEISSNNATIINQMYGSNGNYNHVFKRLQECFPYKELEQYKYRDYSLHGLSCKKKDKEYKYHFKCQNGECRGFLDDKWICGVCSHLTCKDCLTSMGEIKNTDKPAEEKTYLKKIHGCKPEDIETANLIKKDSKPCPKCQTLIYRIDGCLQMFCTFCKTAFDWKTGEIVTKGIHNPHFFQWKNGQMKEFGVGEGGEEDVNQLECCENNNFIQVNTLSKNLIKYDMEFTMKRKERYNASRITIYLMKSLTDFLVGCRNHYNDLLDGNYRLETMDNIHENEILMKFRVDFLIGEITEDEWKQKIAVEENKCLRTSEIRQLIELFTFASGESLTKLRNFLSTNTNSDDKKNVIPVYYEFILETFNLFIYVESQFEKLQHFYNVVMPYFKKDLILGIKEVMLLKPDDNIDPKDSENCLKVNKFLDEIVNKKLIFDSLCLSGYYYNHYEDRCKKDLSHLSKRKVRKVVKEEEVKEKVI